jgi:hypothetical protein
MQSRLIGVYVLSTLIIETVAVKPKSEGHTAADQMLQIARLRQDNYRSYLLRLWRDGEGSQWRASLEDIASGQKQFFANIALLIEFLDGCCDKPPESGPGQPDLSQADASKRRGL